MEMLQLAGLKVAMANARPELKGIADFVTVNDNNNAGVAEIVNAIYQQLERAGGAKAQGKMKNAPDRDED